MPEGIKQNLKFIIDEPAEIDFFKTHSRIASAISQAVLSNPSIKIIGLLGRWGSGKSTIVRQIEAQLKTMDDSFSLFTYDAWLHQHDPLRRSFLESIVSFLRPLAILDQKKWDVELKKLSGSVESVDRYETPLITTEAKLFVVLTAVFAFGASMLKPEVFSAGLGSSTTTAGVWSLRLGVLLIALPILTWVGRVLFLNARGTKTPFFPALLLNRNIANSNTLTVKTGEPTSIEFGKSFRELMKEVSSAGKKLIIVIDNIDRVEEAEALQLWASVRSFFLSSNNDNNIDTEPYHPTVILPIDEKSIAQMFSVGMNVADGEKLASSFVNKTFDVTFDVPAPVMSDWRAYLREQMKYCLGGIFSEDRFFRTRQFMESWFERTDTPVTPREINKSVNRIVGLIGQWGIDEVAYETIAYFSINRSHITGNIAQTVADASSPIAALVPDWARQLAALHFGVSVAHAAQVLMTEPVRQAILTGKASLLDSFVNVSGYGEVFEAVTANLPADSARPVADLEIITNAVKLLPVNDPAEVWTRSAWQNLVSAFFDSSGSALLPDLSDRISPLFDKVAADDAPRFIRKLESLLDEVLSAETLTRDLLHQAGRLGTRAIEFASEREIDEPIFDLRGDAARYIARLSALSGYPLVRQRTRTNANHEELVDNLIRRLHEEDTAADVSGIIDLLLSPASSLITGGAVTNIDAVASAAEANVRDNAGGSAIFDASLETLVAFSKRLPSHRKSLERLAEDGTLTAKLAEVAGSKNVAVQSYVLALLVWGKADTYPPNGSSWSGFLSARKGVAEMANKFLDTMFSKELPINILQAGYDKAYRLKDLAAGLLEDRVRRNNLGNLNSAGVLSKLYDYSRMLPYGLRDRFAEQLTGYSKFWPNIKTAPWSDGIFEAAQLLKRQGGESAGRITEELLDRLRQASADEWASALELGVEPYKIATQIVDREMLKLGVNSALLSALIQSASSVKLASQEVRSRWFELADLLSSPARKRAMEAMGSAILAAPAGVALKLLKSGGARILSEGGFEEKANEVIIDIVIPLARTSKGREWLKDRMAEIKKIITKSDDEPKAALEAAVRGYMKSSSEDKKHWGTVVYESWNIGQS